MNVNASSPVNSGMNMRMSFIVVLLLVVVGLIFVPTASADSYQLILKPGACGSGASCDSYTFTTTVLTTGTANVFNVTFDVKDTGKLVSGSTVYDNSILTNFGLTLFQESAAASSLVMNPIAPSGVTAQLFDNSKTNNGNSMCGSNGSNTGSICLQFNSGTGIPMIGPNAEQSFQFQVTVGGTAPFGLSSWHIMASASPVAGNGSTQPYYASSNSNVYALTNDGTPQLTPEPGSIMLLACGILGLGGLLRRKSR